MKQLYLVGTIHSDLQGKFRLERLLEDIGPTDIFVEGSLMDGYTVLTRYFPSIELLKELENGQRGPYWEHENEVDPARMSLLAECRENLADDFWRDLTILFKSRYFEYIVPYNHIQENEATIGFLEKKGVVSEPRSRSAFIIDTFKRIILQTGEPEQIDHLYTVEKEYPLLERIAIGRRDKDMAKEFEDAEPRIQGNAVIITGNSHFKGKYHNLMQRLEKYTPQYTPLNTVSFSLSNWPEPK